MYVYIHVHVMYMYMYVHVNVYTHYMNAAVLDLPPLGQFSDSSGHVLPVWRWHI